MYGYVSYQQDTFEDVFVLLVRVVFASQSHSCFTGGYLPKPSTWANGETLITLGFPANYIRWYFCWGALPETNSSHLKMDDTVDGSEILHQLGCKNVCK